MNNIILIRYIGGDRFSTLVGIMETCVYTLKAKRDAIQLLIETLFKFENTIAAHRKNASPAENVEWKGDKCSAFGIIAFHYDIGKMMDQNLDNL